MDGRRLHRLRPLRRNLPRCLSHGRHRLRQRSRQLRRILQPHRRSRRRLPGGGNQVFGINSIKKNATHFRKILMQPAHCLLREDLLNHLKMYFTNIISISMKSIFDSFQNFSRWLFQSRCILSHLTFVHTCNSG